MDPCLRLAAGEPLSSAVGWKFAEQFQWDEGFTYLTTLPGKRGEAFYYLPNADPEVIALDENLKQTTTSGELNTGPAMLLSLISLRIEGPA